MITLEQDDLVKFAEKIVDHITVIEGFLQLNSDRKVIECEVKELKVTVLNFIDQMADK